MNDNLFEKYNKIHKEWCHIRNLINVLVVKYIEDTVGFVREGGNSDNVGKTNKNEISWSILNNDTIQISYAVCEDKWLDYWGDDKYIKVKLNDLLKYQDK